MSKENVSDMKQMVFRKRTRGIRNTHKKKKWGQQKIKHKFVERKNGKEEKRKTNLKRILLTFWKIRK